VPPGGNEPLSLCQLAIAAKGWWAVRGWCIVVVVAFK